MVMVVDAKRVVELYESGVSGFAIAKQGGFPTTSVYRILREAGVEMRDGSRAPAVSSERALVLAKEYVDGASLKDLAGREGVSVKAVEFALRRLGVPIRPRGAQREQIPDEVRDRIVSLYKTMSQERVASEVGRSQAFVSRVLREAGVETGFRSGERHHLWKGGWTTGTEGYIRVRLELDSPFWCMRDRAGYVLEHRLVMARSLGRPLTDDETVHHRNGDRADNRLENLQLRQGRHGKGTRVVCLDCGSHNVGAAEV